MDPFCYLCSVSFKLSCLFLVALWSLVGTGLTSWLFCVSCFLVICHFPIWCPGSGVVIDYIASFSLPSFLVLSLVPLK